MKLVVLFLVLGFFYTNGCVPCVCILNILKCTGQGIIKLPGRSFPKDKLIEIILIENTLIKEVSFQNFQNISKIITKDNVFLNCDWVKDVKKQEVVIEGDCSTHSARTLISSTTSKITELPVKKTSTKPMSMETTITTTVMRMTGEAEVTRLRTTKATPGITTRTVVAKTTTALEMATITTTPEIGITTTKNYTDTDGEKDSKIFEVCNSNSFVLNLLIGISALCFIFTIIISISCGYVVYKLRKKVEYVSTPRVEQWYEMNHYETPI